MDVQTFERAQELRNKIDVINRDLKQLKNNNNLKITCKNPSKRSFSFNFDCLSSISDDHTKNCVKSSIKSELMAIRDKLEKEFNQL